MLACVCGGPEVEFAGGGCRTLRSIGTIGPIRRHPTVDRSFIVLRAFDGE